MSNGGMIQILTTNGWRDCFPVGYKPNSVALNVANKYNVEARVVSRSGRVLFTTEED
jgi:hypothetical protein